ASRGIGVTEVNVSEVSAGRGSACQVLDHAEAQVTRLRLDRGTKVVDKATDHLVGEPLQLRVDVRLVPGHRQRGARRHEVDVDDERPVGGEVREFQVGGRAEVV